MAWRPSAEPMAPGWATPAAVLLAAGLLSLMPLSAAAAAPALARGWPIAAPTGTVHDSTVRGGPVVIGLAGDAFAVLAYRPNGVRRWASVRTPACGNCDDGPQVAGLQPDGTYGPIGFEGDDFWAVSGAGQVVAGCAGVVLADGTCIAHRTQIQSVAPFRASPILEATRAGATLWTYVEPSFSWAPEFGVPPLVVRDGAGAIYVGYGAGTDTTTGTPAPARMIAVDGSTGAFRFRQLDAGPLAALDSGVVSETTTGITAYDGDGSVRWTFAETGRVVADVARDRVYVDVGGRIAALRAGTGAELWRTAVADRARLLSIGPTGRVYVAVNRSGRAGLRAILPTGRGIWNYGTATPVAGARELADRTVGVSIEGAANRQGGLMFRIDPRRRAATFRRPIVRLNRSRFTTRCTFGSCDLRPGAGALLRLSLPRAARVTIRLTLRNGRPAPRLVVKQLQVRAPAGTSFVRVLIGENFLARGRYLLRVSWRDRGRTLVRRLPVTAR